ncbi:MAG TPA: hypothetical protein VE525_02155, partial [Rubrobacter sp.]|nr:hypothetical protein [Rubrobacter sp.]
GKGDRSKSPLSGEPHAIWAATGGKLYVGHERGDKVSVIDTSDANNPLDDSVEGPVTGSARVLGFLKKPIDIVISS